MVTKGRRITRGQRPDEQTGPSLFDAEDQADLRRGLDVEPCCYEHRPNPAPLHYVMPSMALACGRDFLEACDATPDEPAVTFTRSAATCPECLASLARS